jgi:hypothetical protein
MKLALALLISAAFFTSTAKAASMENMSCRQLAVVHNQLVNKIVAYSPYYHGEQKIFDLERLQRVYLLMWTGKRCDMKNIGIVSLREAQEAKAARKQERYRNECLPALDANQRKAYNACVERLRAY